MKISGEASLTAGVAEVYAALNDPAVLVRTIPGCQRLQQVGTDSYRATIAAGVASIKGTFDGDVRLADQDAPHSFTLHASGAGVPGTVTAVARVALVGAADGTTRLTYDADATIGGVIGGVGQRVLTGVARKTAGEFFAAVDRALAPGSVGGPVAALVGAAGSGSVEVPVPSPVGVASASAAGVGAAGSGATAGPSPLGVWSAPAPVVDAGRQRARDLMIGAAVGAVIALLGVLVGAIVARW